MSVRRAQDEAVVFYRKRKIGSEPALAPQMTCKFVFHTG